MKVEVRTVIAHKTSVAFLPNQDKTLWVDYKGNLQKMTIPCKCMQYTSHGDTTIKCNPISICDEKGWGDHDCMGEYRYLGKNNDSIVCDVYRFVDKMELSYENKRANFNKVKELKKTIYPPSQIEAKEDSVTAYYKAKCYIIENQSFGSCNYTIDDCFGSRPIELDKRAFLNQVLPDIRKKDSLYWYAMRDILQVLDSQSFVLEKQYLFYYFYIRTKTIRNFQTSKEGYTFSIPVEVNPLSIDTTLFCINENIHYTKRGGAYTFHGILKWNGQMQLISIETREPNPCPVCFSPETPISTPNGEIPINQLQIGNEIYSLDENGKQMIVNIVQKDSMNVGNTHHVLEIEYENGEKIYVSPNHPDAKDIPVMHWKAEEVKDNQIIKQVKVVPYTHTHTYDILPNSKSRAYLVKGVWMKSTLFP